MNWIGQAPSKCDLCDDKFHDDTFIDGKTTMGDWGCMCITCHAAYGVGLGKGLGQKYHKQPDGSYVKVSV